MNSRKEIIKNIIIDVLDFFGIDYDIKVEEDNSLEMLVFNIETLDSSLLIGSGGDNLNALQLIIKMMAMKKIDSGSYVPFSIDVNDYRKRRIAFIKETTNNIADKVELTKKSITLQPMSAFERRIVHMEILNRGGAIVTESVGDGFDRKVVIKPV